MIRQIALLGAAVAALSLAACGAEPLRTKEEAVAIAVNGTDPVVNSVQAPTPNLTEGQWAITMSFDIYTDPTTQCQYIVVRNGDDIAVTPRYAPQTNGAGPHHTIVGCTSYYE